MIGFLVIITTFVVVAVVVWKSQNFLLLLRNRDNHNFCFAIGLNCRAKV